MGVLDIILGRDDKGNASKINMALIALLLWRWYQASGRSAGASPAAAGRGEAPAPQPRNVPENAPARIPSGTTAAASGDGASPGDFGELLDSMGRMPQTRGGRARDVDIDDESGNAPGGGGPGGGGHDGGLGDILGEILRGGRSGAPGGRGPGGGGLGDVLGGGRGRSGGRGGPGGGGLGDILGDILGGGRSPARMAAQGGNANSLDDIFPGGLGGLLAGGAGGGVLGDLLKQFDAAGQGAAARSWVARGENIPVTPRDIEQTFGSGIIDQLAARFDLPREQLLSGLSEAMPQVVDQLTPDGRLPTPEEISQRA